MSQIFSLAASLGRVQEQLKPVGRDHMAVWDGRARGDGGREIALEYAVDMESEIEFSDESGS